jgi:hypothetical protein
MFLKNFYNRENFIKIFGKVAPAGAFKRLPTATAAQRTIDPLQPATAGKAFTYAFIQARAALVGQCG